MQLKHFSEIEMTIHDLGVHGEGIGKYHDLVIFVDGALPMEKVKVQLTELKKNYAIGKLLEIVEASPYRQKPICPVFGRCGGCQIMHLQYDEQLKMKENRVKSALLRLAKVDPERVYSCERAPFPLHYRNKIQLPVAGGEETIHLGLYQRNSHDVIPIEQCFIHTPLGEKVFQHVKTLLQSFEVKAFDPESREGELRHLLIRTAVFERKVLVALISAKPASESLKKFAKALFNKLEEVKGVIFHLNDRSDNVVLDKNFKILEGEDHITEKFNDLFFKVSAASFFQINPHQAIPLYEKAIQLAELHKEDHVLDAYCGVGTLTLFIAKYTKHVIGVESISQAILDAKDNAKINQIFHVDFLCAKVEDIVKTLPKVDVVFINPPRKGCEKSVLKTLSQMGPRAMIYISCDPATLARDAAFLEAFGYYLDVAIPFDMFPQTMHVETIARFKRKATKV